MTSPDLEALKTLVAAHDKCCGYFQYQNHVAGDGDYAALGRAARNAIPALERLLAGQQDVRQCAERAISDLDDAEATLYEACDTKEEAHEARVEIVCRAFATVKAEWIPCSEKMPEHPSEPVALHELREMWLDFPGLSVGSLSTRCIREMSPEQADFYAKACDVACASDAAPPVQEAGRDWYPEACPITQRPFFMTIEHPEHGMVPTYGGPYDSYTIPERDDDGDWICERYDHDDGAWVEGWESTGLVVVKDSDLIPAEPASLGADIEAATLEILRFLAEWTEEEYTYENISDIIKRHLQHQPIKAGWVSVPKEPTEAMLIAADDVKYARDEWDALVTIYKAMLSAAPVDTGDKST